ncbi:hypothetical protein ACP4OV_005538 [Aristida adscensionis]
MADAATRIHDVTDDLLELILLRRVRLQAMASRGRRRPLPPPVPLPPRARRHRLLLQQLRRAGGCEQTAAKYSPVLRRLVSSPR